MSGTTQAIDWRDKGIWHPGAGEPAAEFLERKPSLFSGVCSWPVMVLRQDSLDRNIDTLAAFCAAHRLDFAPHGKTTMAPGAYDRQIAAGAWGITFATAHQVLVGRRSGLKRILLANELLDPVAIAWLADEVATDSDFEFACYVDSPAGVRAIAEIGARRGIGAGFPVLLEIGFAGGRTGVRTRREARELAELVAATNGIRLVGVAAYEGGLPTPDAVRGYFAEVRAVVAELVEASLLPARPIVTAGGSSYFDMVAQELAGEWAASLDLQVILRSGAYVSHDDGTYKLKTAYNRIPEEGGLTPAIEVWAQVLSTPDPGLAIVGMGKRDAPYDEGMPIPLRIRRAGRTEQEPVRAAVCTKMDDHHGYVALPDGMEVAPGDLICFGISHPCTAFDKWRQLPVIDENYVITDVLRTYF